MPSWRSIASVTAAAALGALATTAVVDAQSAPQTLDACAGARGALRLVAPGEACVSGERRVSWNVAGPAGAAGPAGPAGATGARGPRGRGGKVHLKLSGTPQIVLALKLLNKRVKGLSEQLTALNGKVGKAAALDRRTYERLYNVCLGMESLKTPSWSTVAATGVPRCKYGFYKPWPGYDPEW
jgi:hypothetical protein